MKHPKIFATQVRLKQGFSLTELAIIMGIVGVVLAAIWVTAGKVSENEKAAKTVAEIYYIVDNVRNIYGRQLSSGTGTSSFINSAAIPTEMMVNGVPKNPWGTTSGAADIAGAGIGIGNPGWGGGCSAVAAPNVLQISVWGISKVACQNVLSKFVGPGAGTDILCVYSDGTGPFLTPYATTPNQISTTNGGCQDGGNITLYFHL